MDDVQKNMYINKFDRENGTKRHCNSSRKINIYKKNKKYCDGMANSKCEIFYKFRHPSSLIFGIPYYIVYYIATHGKFINNNNKKKNKNRKEMKTKKSHFLCVKIKVFCMLGSFNLGNMKSVSMDLTK